LILARRGTGEITGYSTEIGFEVHKITGDHGDFVAADEAEGVATRVGMIELLGNHCVSTGDGVTDTGCGSGCGKISETKHGSLLVGGCDFLAS
jgi:hypothetical protein